MHFNSKIKRGGILCQLSEQAGDRGSARGWRPLSCWPVSVLTPGGLLAAFRESGREGQENIRQLPPCALQLGIEPATQTQVRTGN